MGKVYCVYKHTTPNGKVYIGITSRKPERRWRNGTGYRSSPHFNAAIEKYGWENIKHEIVADGLSKEDACIMEKALIQTYDSTNHECGYNGTFGGETGIKITPEVRRKISEKSKAYYADPTNRKKISDRMTGIKKSEDAKRHMSEAAKRRKPHRMTDEWKRKIGEANRCKYSTQEWKDANKDQINKLRLRGIEKSKAVEQIGADGSVLAIFRSMKEAYRKTGVRDGNISKCCNGLTKTAGGYIWRYAS